MSLRDHSSEPAVNTPNMVQPKTYTRISMVMAESVITEFEAAIFIDGWATTDDSLMEPKIADRKFLQTSIVAGRFTKDLPNKGKPQELAARKACQPTYLKVHVGGAAESLGWLWTDAQGRIANKAYTDMNQDELELMWKAVLKYDKWEKLRVLPYNAEVAVYIARHRLLAWSKTGYHSPAPGKDARFELFTPLVLASQLLQEHRCVAELLDTGVSSSLPLGSGLHFNPLP
ncbi:hypothetical protein DL763_003323 [Monosporascus cannonballus]|nr:hypothetical protein DL763_003323 [Monosporascus cannonballus]